MYVNDVDCVKDVDVNVQALRLQRLELIWQYRRQRTAAAAAAA